MVSKVALGQSSYPNTRPVHENLFAAEDRHFWFRARNAVIAAALDRVIQSLPPDFRILEIGCGTGNVLRVLERRAGGGRTFGVDLFPGGLRYARQRTNCNLIQADMHQPPFRILFDVIGIFDVLEHQADDLVALGQIHGLLRRGGKLLLTVPAHMSLWSYADRLAGHHRRYECNELDKRLRAAGFHVDYLSPYMAALSPMMYLARHLVRDRNAQNEDQQMRYFSRELRPIPFLNGLLLWILKRESAIVRAGRPLPFGTSLIAIASKLL